MPRKYDLIVQLSEDTASKISSSPAQFVSFLGTAASNYKYGFEDQLLIFAQKKNAVACAEIETWNKLGRWVNKGTKGIALLVDGTQYRLRYVFDISDTNSYYGHNVRLWNYDDRFRDQVTDALENSFGEIEQKARFEDAVINISGQVVDDNISDYLEQLSEVTAGSALGSYAPESIEKEFRYLLTNSVAYAVLLRCGIDMAKIYSIDDFSGITDFNTPETLAVVGNATSDISEMILREIEVTVRAAEKEELENRTFAQTNDLSDNEIERSDEYGTDIQTGGGLPSSEPRSAGESEDREIRDASPQIPPGTQESDIHGNDDLRKAERSSGTDRPGGDGGGGEADRSVGAETWSDRADEENRSDEVGWDDELAEGVGGGNGTRRTHLQLSGHDFDVRSEIPYYYAPDEKNELLRNCTALKNHRKEIAAFFEVNDDRKERGDFIKSFFDETFVEHILENGERVGYRAYDDLLHIWHGSYLSRDKEDFIPWWRVASFIQGQMLLMADSRRKRTYLRRRSVKTDRRQFHRKEK